MTTHAAPAADPSATESAPSRVADDQSCPSCGSVEVRTLFRGKDRLYRTTDKPFFVVECRECRLLRLYPYPAPAELRRYYPESYWYLPEADRVDRLAEAYRRFVLRDHVGFVRRALRDTKEEGPVLDVGCGGGLFLHLMKSGGRPVMGLDFSFNAASIAWRVNGVATVCGDLSSTPFPPESCAGVTMFHVLEHLYNPASYLEAARRILKPDGRLIVQVPNAGSWQFLFFGENWSGVDIPRHLVNFKVSDLDDLLHHCGFEVVRHKHFSLRDNPAGLATTLAPWLDPMARRIRGTRESGGGKLVKDLLYLGLVALSVPFAVLEAACNAGSTIMVEARKAK